MKKIKIRLNDIDAPEAKQAFGNKSKENIKKFIYQKDVIVEYKKKDQYKEPTAQPPNLNNFNF